MTNELSERIEAFLKNHYTMTLATVGDDGMPWAATVFFINDGLDLWWLSKPDARHSVHIARHPCVAVAINGECAERRAVRGLQMEGRAEAMGAPALMPALVARYAAKFSSLGDLAHPSVDLARTLLSSRLYRFVPARAVYVDQAGGARIREQIDLRGDDAALAVGR